MKEHHVIKKAVREEGRILRLTFEDGSVRDLDMHMYAHRGGVFKRLLEPDYVKKMKPVSGGYILEFPDGATWSAQVCWLEGVPVRPLAKASAGKPLFAAKTTSAKTR